MKRRSSNDQVTEEELAEARNRNRKRLAHVLDHQPEVIKNNIHRTDVRKGVKFSEVYEVYKAHDGKCAICGETRKGNKRNLALDHYHKTNKVRGILCMRCNVALGMFDDDVDKLRNAIAYLARYGSAADSQSIDSAE